MPQSLFGYCREGHDRALRIDLQHLVVSEVKDIQISLAVEGNAVWAPKEIAFCERRNGIVRGNLCDRIIAAICDIDVSRLPVDRYAYGTAQAASDEWLGLSLSINLGD